MTADAAQSGSPSNLVNGLAAKPINSSAPDLIIKDESTIYGKSEGTIIRTEKSIPFFIPSAQSTGKHRSTISIIRTKANTPVLCGNFIKSYPSVLHYRYIRFMTE